jgi:hypothetical protein
MGLQFEDHFPGDKLEELDSGLDLGDEVLDDETTDDEPGDNADRDDSGDSDADADPGADADGDADQESGDADPNSEDAESESDGEDTGADKPAESQPPKSEKGPVIPKARLDQELRKRRVAEQRTQELEQEIAQMRREQAEASRPKPITPDEIRAKMVEANQALIAGDTDRAAELQAELLGAIATPAAPVAETPQERDLVAEVEARMEFKSTLVAINERFPELDENSELFDEELSLEAVDLQRSYMSRGFSLAEATRKAAESVAKLNDLEDRKAAPAIAPKAAVARARQNQKTQEKVAKATKAPPALTGRVDNGNDVAFDVYKATEDELAALPQAALDRLLGNSL